MRVAMQGTRPPRVLITGYKNSEVIGPPNDHEEQLALVRAALKLLMEAETPGTVEELPKRF